DSQPWISPNEFVMAGRQSLHSTEINRHSFAIPRPFSRGDDNAGGPIVDQAVIEQMEWLANEARLLMVINVENLTHNCAGILRGVFAKGDRDCCELATA